MLPGTEEALKAKSQMKNSFHVWPESKRIITDLLMGHLMFEVHGPLWLRSLFGVKILT